MKTNLFAFLLTILGLSIFTINGSAQLSEKFNFRVDFSTKISIGKGETGEFQFDRFTRIYYPTKARYDFPTTGLEFIGSYSLSDHFEAGMLSGLHVAFAERTPLVANTSYTRYTFPVALLVMYKFRISQNLSFRSQIAGGYLFQHANFVETEDGFLATRKGGYLIESSFAVVFDKFKRQPFLRVSFENHAEYNRSSLGWTRQYQYGDNFEYFTNFQFIKLALGMNI